jgi:hypothetical protein
VLRAQDSARAAGGAQSERPDACVLVLVEALQLGRRAQALERQHVRGERAQPRFGADTHGVQYLLDRRRPRMAERDPETVEGCR